MAVLDTFYILFDADTSQLKTGLRDVGRETEILGRKVTNADQRIARMLRRSISVLAVLGGLRNAVDYSEGLYRSSEALGANITELGAWSSAVVKAGGTADGFQQGLTEFAKKFNLTADQALAKLPELADKFKSLGNIQALKLGRELGFDDRTIVLLQKGRKEVEELIIRQKALGVVTKEDAEIIHAYNLEWENTAQVLNVFSTQALGNVLPGFNKFLQLLQDGFIWLRQYPNLVQGLTYGLTAVGAILTVIAAKAVLAFLPISLMSGALLLVGLAAIAAYDDIKTFMEGGESITGLLLDRFPRIQKIIEEVIGTLKQFWQVLTWKPGEESFSAMWNRVFFNDMGPTVNIPAHERAFRTAKETAFNPGLPDGMREYLNHINSPSAFDVPTPQQMLQNATSEEYNKALNYITNVDNITINTQATDGEQLLRDINGELGRQNRQAQANFEDGILY